MSRSVCDVTLECLDDGELRLRRLTWGDKLSFLRDTQHSAVAVKMYVNYEALACET